MGVRGEVGGLHWLTDGDDVPINGLNESIKEYAEPVGGYDNLMPPRAEMPIDVVYQAVEEFYRTRERPTCVEYPEIKVDLNYRFFKDSEFLGWDR